MPVKLVPPEEMIWSKAYVMERERCDGADIMHLLRARGPCLDWDRVLARLDAELASRPPRTRLGQGTLLSRHQYRVDLEQWSYRDGRLRPNGRMTRRQARAVDRER